MRNSAKGKNQKGFREWCDLFITVYLALCSAPRTDRTSVPRQTE